MKFRLCKYLFAVVLTGVLASCSSSTSATPQAQASAASKGDSSLSGKVFDEVNLYRASKGKPALQRHAGLDRIAQEHCNYLVKTAGSYDIYGKNISHIGFETRAIAAREYYKINSLGENVISSTDHSPKLLVKLWANSKGHEYNMRADWDCTGVATAITADGQVVSTQLFGTSPSNSQMDMKKRFNRGW